MNVITSTRTEKPETEVEFLHDEIMTLKMAIEEAIIKGQKSLDLVSDVPEWAVICDEDSSVTCAMACPGVIGWIDDF